MGEDLEDVDAVEEALIDADGLVVLDAENTPWLIADNEHGAFFVGRPEENDELGGRDEMRGFFREQNPDPERHRPVFPLHVLANR